MNSSRTVIAPSAALSHTGRASTLASLALAATLTLATLLGINTLASSDLAAPQLAQTASAQA